MILELFVLKKPVKKTFSVPLNAHSHMFFLLMQLFRNPYHHGRLNNWKLLFGVETRR